MKKIRCILLLLTCTQLLHAQDASQPSLALEASPRQLFPGLFEAVQLGSVFPDNKTFVDMTPKSAPAAILADWNRQKNQAGFNLKEFAIRNFYPPAGSGINFKSNIKAGIRVHIDTLWQVLSREANPATSGSLLPLTYNYIIPGGRFREIYYWDSYFTMLGLKENGKIETISNMIRNFGDIIDRYGFIPNGTRTYYLDRSQPPFFSMMVELLAKDKGDAVYTTYHKELLAEYKFWMQGADTLEAGHSFRNLIKLPDGEFLNRYWSSSDKPREESFKQDMESVALSHEDSSTYFRNIRAAAESGWDFSTRWFGEPGTMATIHTTDLAAIDLNCLLYHLEQSLAKSYQVAGEKKQQALYLKKARARKLAILKYCWDSHANWFKDYNYKTGETERIETLAGAFPLEFGIPSHAQAKNMADKIRTKFMKPGGLVTTLNRSGQQWDSPNGWAPLQYITIDGLSKNHFGSLASTLAKRWIRLNLHVFQQTGKLVEKYNVIDINLKAGGGEYALQDGFGWTNGTLLNLMNRFEPLPANLNKKPEAVKPRHAEIL